MDVGPSSVTDQMSDLESVISVLRITVYHLLSGDDGTMYLPGMLWGIGTAPDMYKFPVNDGCYNQVQLG